MDRWSRRVIGGWADEIGGRAIYPFGGPPFHPFFSWATRSGWIHQSPVRLLVHADAGLWVSFRGALALPDRIPLPPPPPSPCLTCTAQPCRTACPADALTDAGYDVPACKAFLAAPEGQVCMKTGCGVRAACPAGRGHGRLAAHSTYHMQQFI
ncbi:ferredoxin [Pseudooceanicola sp. LIPI14-2-Ac024]|uniref:ferredoxin n=1 Tax=Pseudooceanicola sp. LIPI14-2-Ac024 TaxID=3344875 RepID=UPI0035CECAAF